MSQLLQQIDLLLEQINTQQKQQPGAGKLVAQNIGASVLPAIAASMVLQPKMKEALIKKGVSGDSLVSGVNNFSKADIAAQGASSLTGMAAGAIGKKMMQKYQERKYGIYQPKDTRTTGQKIVDTGLNVAQRAVSIGSSVATRAAIGSVLGPGALTAAGGMLALPAFMAAGVIASKPLNKVRQKIQEKRQQEQAQAQQQSQ